MSLTNENQDVKVPWWFNEESSRMLNGGYLLRGENLDGALERITSAAAKRLKRPDLKEKFKEIVWNGWMSLSSPIWANMGTQRGLPISCMLSDTLIEVKSGDVHLTMTIEELTKRWDEGVRNFQIKVFNTDTKTIEYSKINRVWETKKTKSLVYLSVGEAGTNNIRCTPDHLILMSNGEYKPAEEIKTLDKLQGESYKTVVEVKNVEVEEEVSVFDIEVDHPSHNFYLPEAEVFVHNCFGVNVPDSLNLISDKLKEVTMQTKIGGGTSGYFGNIRERGAKIKDNGESSGPVPFMQLFDTTMGVVSQGGVRRGAFAAYLDIDHPDFEEFLQVRDIGNPIQNLFTGACIPDYWMQEMVDGDMEKRRIWAKVLESRQQKGLPYLFFTDNVNKNKPQVYKDNKMQITHSNLCIAGSDRVVSNYGYLTAKELYDLGTELTLFDGRNPVKSSPMKLREKDVPTYKVTLKNGMEHTITDYHKVKVVGYGGQYREVALKDLKVGDKVVLQESKGLFGTEDNYDLAYLLGWYHSDGTQHGERTFIDLWENSFDKLDEIQETFTRVYSAYGGNTYNIKNQTGRVVGQRHRDTPKFGDCQVREGSQAKKRLGTNLFSKNDLGFKKGEIPDWIWRSDERTQWRYVQSLFEGDGSVYMYDCPEKGSPIQLYISSINLEFLKQLQKLLYNLGVRPSIYAGKAAGSSLLPDGKGGQKLYQTKQCYKLAIGNRPDCVKVNQMTGFLDRKGVKLELSENYRDNTRNHSPVESIEFHSNQDVYCPTVETEEHVFVCNGIQTFNCSEVSLIDTPDESFVCCLSSLNLELYDEWKNTDTVKLAIYFLDAVMSEFIENSAGIPGLEAVNKFAKRHRSLGLGE